MSRKVVSKDCEFRNAHFANCLSISRSALPVAVRVTTRHGAVPRTRLKTGLFTPLRGESGDSRSDFDFAMSI